MSDERRRHRMRAKLDEVLGTDVAGDVMEALPPFDWTRIATKDDLQLIHGRLDNIDGRLDNLDGRFDNMDRRFDLLEQRMNVTMLKISLGSTLVSLAAISGLLALFD